MSMSLEQKKYLKNIRKTKIKVKLCQLSIIFILLISWELAAFYKIINPFIFSSPSAIIQTIHNLFQQNNLFPHIFTTVFETIIAFSLGIGLGMIIAIILYRYTFIAKVIDPYLTLLNSLPKIALGPILIIWIGANTNSIIAMALLINLIISITTIYNGFCATDPIKLKLMQSFKSNKLQILTKLVIPESYPTIISSLKLNISMSLIGVIMGEFLVSKKGIGYLIMYGTQVFNLNLVMSGITLLLIISFILYQIVSQIEKKLLKK